MQLAGSLVERQHDLLGDRFIVQRKIERLVNVLKVKTMRNQSVKAIGILQSRHKADRTREPKLGSRRALDGQVLPNDSFPLNRYHAFMRVTDSR